MTGGAASGGNLTEAHRELVALVARLDAAVGDARDAAEVRALTARIADTDRRVTAIGRARLAEQTAGLSAAAAEISRAIPRVEEALDRVGDMQAALAALSGVLGLCDKAIGIARGDA